MSKTPLVSIITPTYNHENYIADCIKSAQAQIYENWEMIIVNDGSTDNTFNIANKFAESDTRIKLITQENVGIFRLGESYNRALSLSKGKYIAILEGDDVWLSNKLLQQVNAMEADDSIVLSYGNAYSSTSDLSSDYSLTDIASNQNQSTRSNQPLGSATKVLLFSNFIVALTVVIKRETLIQIGGFKQSHKLPLVDLTTWLELSLYGKFEFINEPLGKWRFYPNQITKTYTAEISQGFYEFALDFHKRNLGLFQAQNISTNHIHSFFKKQLVEAHSRSGRYKLIRKDFNGARRNYFQSIFFYGFRGMIWKLRSVIGLIFSLFHADIETFAKKMGRVSYK